MAKQQIPEQAHKALTLEHELQLAKVFSCGNWNISRNATRELQDFQTKSNYKTDLVNVCDSISTASVV
jgi:hypothetical protein